MSILTELPTPRVVPSPSPSPSAISLLVQARQELARAVREPVAAEKFAQAHLAALRGAAAVLALRGRPHRGRSKPTSAWVLLVKMAPELAEWAVFFEAASASVGMIRSGITRFVTAGDAEELLGQASQFLDLVEGAVCPAYPSTA